MFYVFLCCHDFAHMITRIYIYTYMNTCQLLQPTASSLLQMKTNTDTVDSLSLGKSYSNHTHETRFSPHDRTFVPHKPLVSLRSFAQPRLCYGCPVTHRSFQSHPCISHFLIQKTPRARASGSEGFEPQVIQEWGAESQRCAYLQINGLCVCVYQILHLSHYVHYIS